jgi:hypothetical protein
MKKLLLFLSISFFIVSCDKDDDPAPKTKTQLLAQDTWKFSAATVGGADASPFLQTCQKDNVMTFNAAGTGNINEGATKCNAPDPQDNPFTWTWQNNETMLQASAVFFTGGSNTFTLVGLSETQLELSQMITLGGTPQKVVVTFIN